MIVYLEGDVVLDIAQKGPRARLTDQNWLGRWETAAGVQVHVPEVRGAPETPPPIYERAVAARDGEIPGGVRQAQYAQPMGPPAPGSPGSVTRGARRIAGGLETTRPGTPPPHDADGSAADSCLFPRRDASPVHLVP